MTKMKHIVNFAAVAAAFALCAAGCASAPSPGDADPRIAIDRSAANLVRTVAVDYGTSKSDTPTLSVTVKSISGSTRKLQYRVVWMGANGLPLDSALSVWKIMTLDPGEIGDCRAIAPRSDVHSFRFELRKAR